MLKQSAINSSPITASVGRTASVGNGNGESNEETDLEQKIKTEYRRMGYPSLRRVKCRFNGERLTLSGSTNSFFLKQVAQVIAAKVSGLMSIENLIEVP